MSRGPGHVQRKLLALIKAQPGPFDLEQLFDLVYGDAAPTRALRGSLVRALHMKLPRHWTFGRLPHDSRRWLYNAARPPKKLYVHLRVVNLSDALTEFELDDTAPGFMAENTRRWPTGEGNAGALAGRRQAGCEANRASWRVDVWRGDQNPARG
jgi:hypothetical protein